MKTKMLIILMRASLPFAGLQVQSSGGYIGFQYLPTFAKVDEQVTGGVIKTTAVLGFGAGAELGFNRSDHLALQGEFLYASLAPRYIDATNIERKINLTYFNIPLLLALNSNSSLQVNLNVVAGPQIGINIGATVEGGSSGSTDTSTAVLAVKVLQPINTFCLTGRT